VPSPAAGGPSAGRLGAGRVIAGSARGIRLAAPGGGTRPLGDRVKQTLFAILEPRLRDRALLDLFAGSGAAGIEALSRGASRAVFVERDRTATQVIEQNLAAAGLGGSQALVIGGDVAAYLARAAAADGDREPFVAIVIDPPYDEPSRLDDTLRAIAEAGRGVILATDGVVVAKHFWKTPPAGMRLLRSDRVIRFGETALTFLRWADEEDG
jgi:16S rRNA (guanine966-N2)-methyltransferase